MMMKMKVIDLDWNEESEPCRTEIDVRTLQTHEWKKIVCVVVETKRMFGKIGQQTIGQSDLKETKVLFTFFAFNFVH